MKKERAIALNYAFVGGCIALCFAVICWVFDKPLTVNEYQVPFDYENGKYSFLTIPQLSIWFLPIFITLGIFQIIYLKQLYFCDKKYFIAGAIAGTFSGIILGTISGTIFGTISGTIFGTVLGAIFKKYIFGTIFGTVLGTINIFFFVLMHTNLGFGEAFGYSIITFCILLFVNIITNSIIPFCIAVGERVVIIGKSPQMVGLD